MIFDGVADGGSGEQGIEPPPSGGGVVLGEDGLNNGLLRERFARLGWFFAFGFEVIDMETKNVRVLDGVRDCVRMELFLEELTGRLKRGLLILYLHTAGVFFKDGRAGKAEKLGLGEELLDGFMVLAELGAVALVEDEDDSFVAKRFKLLLEGLSAVIFLLLVALTVFIQREAEFLDGADDDLVGVVVREETAHQSASIGIFLNAAFLEFVELLARLPVEVLAVDDEEAFFDVRVVLEES